MIGDISIGVLEEWEDDPLSDEELKDSELSELIRRRRKTRVRDNEDGTASIVGECIGMGF
jgi:hypothetical protein